MNQKRAKKWLLLVLWMIVIFLFSNQPHSGNVTHNIIEKIIPTLKNHQIIDILNYIVRKSAHIAEYFVLAYLLYSLLKEYTKNEKKKIILSIIFCFLYACTDELHQMLVPGRSSLFKDCLIDTFGSCLYITAHIVTKKK